MSTSPIVNPLPHRFREAPSDDNGGPGRDADVVDESDQADEESPERAVHCAACETEITSDKYRRQASGKFEHCFSNPAGILYCIGCFDEAPGCVPFGEETDEFTWFDGYAWRIVLCGNCGAQLGWSYWCEGDSFFGLILKRLS